MTGNVVVQRKRSGNMYYYLKNNCFYLKQNDDGLFIKNNFCSVSIKNPQSYKLFKMILPVLNGKIDVEEQMEKLTNNGAKNFFMSLLDVLKKNKFVLYSKTPINIDDYSEEEQSILFCYGGIMPTKNENTDVVYTVHCADDKIGKIICDILCCAKLETEQGLVREEYICVRGIKKLFIYKNNDNLIVSSIFPTKNDTDNELFKLPHHIFEIIASFLRIELMLNAMGIHDIDFSRENYVLNLKLLNGSNVPIGGE